MQARRTWTDWETRTIAFLQWVLLEAQENLGAFRKSTPLPGWCSSFHYLLAFIFPHQQRWSSSWSLQSFLSKKHILLTDACVTHVLQHFCLSSLLCVHINPLSLDVLVDISPVSASQFHWRSFIQPSQRWSIVIITTIAEIISPLGTSNTETHVRRVKLRSVRLTGN